MDSQTDNARFLLACARGQVVPGFIFVGKDPVQPSEIAKISHFGWRQDGKRVNVGFYYGVDRRGPHRPWRRNDPIETADPDYSVDAIAWLFNHGLDTSIPLSAKVVHRSIIVSRNVGSNNFAVGYDTITCQEQQFWLNGQSVWIVNQPPSLGQGIACQYTTVAQAAKDANLDLFLENAPGVWSMQPRDLHFLRNRA